MEKLAPPENPQAATNDGAAHKPVGRGLLPPKTKTLAYHGGSKPPPYKASAIRDSKKAAPDWGITGKVFGNLQGKSTAFSRRENFSYSPLASSLLL